MEDQKGQERTCVEAGKTKEALHKVQVADWTTLSCNAHTTWLLLLNITELVSLQSLQAADTKAPTVLSSRYMVFDRKSIPIVAWKWARKKQI